ncbi:hypothetical protein SA21340_0422 [Staphylococcus aureus subsp. aureus 21340]|nr:hypothetical protein SA21340_0422 [Staphylococcus aureus subsp. aureus 21340]
MSPITVNHILSLFILFSPSTFNTIYIIPLFNLNIIINIIFYI